MMRSNKEVFELSLAEYREIKKDYEQKYEAYDKAYAVWEIELDKNGDMTDLGKKLNNAISELDSTKKMYDLLAHQVLRYYELL